MLYASAQKNPAGDVDDLIFAECEYRVSER